MWHLRFLFCLVRGCKVSHLSTDVTCGLFNAYAISVLLKGVSHSGILWHAVFVEQRCGWAIIFQCLKQFLIVHTESNSPLMMTRTGQNWETSRCLCSTALSKTVMIFLVNLLMRRPKKLVWIGSVGVLLLIAAMDSFGYCRFFSRHVKSVISCFNRNYNFTSEVVFKSCCLYLSYVNIVFK
jgi:hypothetical protein